MKSKFLLLSALLILAGCGGKVEVETEVHLEDQLAQQVADVMASIDEMGGSDGDTTTKLMNQEIEAAKKSLIRVADLSIEKNNLMSLILPEAQAASCANQGFGVCSANQIVRNFGNCTVGGFTFSGTVTMVWSAASCNLSSSGSTVRRSPDFRISGVGEALISVIKTGTNGETLENNAGVYTFRSDGITRKIDKASETLYQVLSTVTSPISLSGTGRSGRTLSGGPLVLTNALNGDTCSLTPTSVTWTGSACNCPSSGSWTGSCTKSGSFNLTIKSCGTGSIAIGTAASRDVTFDRCGS